MISGQWGSVTVYSAINSFPFRNSDVLDLRAGHIRAAIARDGLTVGNDVRYRFMALLSFVA